MDSIIFFPVAFIIVLEMLSRVFGWIEIAMLDIFILTQSKNDLADWF
jgi:hypothetical protein